MLLQAVKGNRSLFVGGGELVEAWRIFTPLLDAIDRERPEPLLYPFGSPAPDGLPHFARARGVSIDAADMGPTPVGDPDVEAPSTPDKHSTKQPEPTSSVKSCWQQREPTPPRQWRKLKSHP